jgi:hypothetical protein
LPPEEALRQFNEKAAGLTGESFRDQWCPELAAMSIDESTQHIHFDRVTAVIGDAGETWQRTKPGKWEWTGG